MVLGPGSPSASPARGGRRAPPPGGRRLPAAISGRPRPGSRKGKADLTNLVSCPARKEVATSPRTALRLQQVGGGVPDQAGPEQADLPAMFLIDATFQRSRSHGAGPSQLTPPARRGNSCHTKQQASPTARRRSATDRPARTATPTPSRRPRSPPTNPAKPIPAGSTGPSSGSTATAHHLNCVRIRSPRSLNRRSQRSPRLALP